MITRRAFLLGSAGMAAGACGCTPTPAHPAESTPHSPVAVSRTATTSTPAFSARPTTPSLPTWTTPPRQWGTDVAGVVQRTTSAHVCLTFDACGGPHGSGVDHALLALLRRLVIPATLFLNERWIQANPRVAAELGRDRLFELANHGSRHVPLSMRGQAAYGIVGTRSVDEVRAEVTSNVAALRRLTGRAPRFFRSGTAHYDEQAVALCRAWGQTPVGFDVNADAGATFTARQVARALAAVRPGSIVIAHMNQPAHETAEGFTAALPRLVERGVTFARLSEVL